MTTLTVTRGDTPDFLVTLTEEDGTPLDLTGLLIDFTAKRYKSDTDAEALIQKSVGNGISVDADPTSGLCTLHFFDYDTDGIDARTRRFYWDIQVTDGTEVVTPLEGRLVVTPDVTQTPGS